MLKTRVTEILGIEYPIIAGPMAYLSGPELVSAVSNAGGLGIIASLSYQTIAEFREAIKRTQQLTDKPFAANVTLLPMARQVNYEEYFVAALDEGVNIIETSGRSPEPFKHIAGKEPVNPGRLGGFSQHQPPQEQPHDGTGPDLYKYFPVVRPRGEYAARFTKNHDLQGDDQQGH